MLKINGPSLIFLKESSTEYSFKEFLLLLIILRVNKNDNTLSAGKC